jgi:hypothetical protein
MQNICVSYSIPCAFDTKVFVCGKPLTMTTPQSCAVELPKLDSVVEEAAVDNATTPYSHDSLNLWVAALAQKQLDNQGQQWVITSGVAYGKPKKDHEKTKEVGFFGHKDVYQCPRHNMKKYGLSLPSL